jgi:predicted class III extradiol MEMO1 family dioxygenase
MNVHTIIKMPTTLLLNGKLMIQRRQKIHKKDFKVSFCSCIAHVTTHIAYIYIDHVALYNYSLLYMHFWPVHFPFRLVIFSPSLTRRSKATVITRDSIMIAGSMDRNIPKLALI